jgi:altronate hydrolase
MSDIIDVDTGKVVSGETTIEHMGEEILEQVIKIASGKTKTRSELNGQNDFIPWKAGVSL